MKSFTEKYPRNTPSPLGAGEPAPKEAHSLRELRGVATRLTLLLEALRDLEELARTDPGPIDSGDLEAWADNLTELPSYLLSRMEGEAAAQRCGGDTVQELLEWMEQELPGVLWDFKEKHYFAASEYVSFDFRLGPRMLCVFARFRVNRFGEWRKVSIASTSVGAVLRLINGEQ